MAKLCLWSAGQLNKWRHRWRHLVKRWRHLLKKWRHLLKKWRHLLKGWRHHILRGWRHFLWRWRHFLRRWRHLLTRWHHCGGTGGATFQVGLQTIQQSLAIQLLIDTCMVWRSRQEISIKTSISINLSKSWSSLRHFLNSPSLKKQLF